MKKSYYNPHLIKNARSLRKNPTYGERLLWSRVRNRQVNHVKFKRQYPVIQYILDFYSPQLKLGIEIDGSSHDDKKFAYDRLRENNLQAIGINLLRFTEYEVRTRLDDVLETIYLRTQTSTSP